MRKMIEDQPAPPTVAPLAPALGGRVEKLDDIGPTIAERLVVALPDQDLTPAGLVALTGRFGRPIRVPYITPLADHPEVIAVKKTAAERRISVFGGDWHSDFSFLPEPPSLTLLYAVEVPPIGGDTLFANMALAFESLSAGLRATLRGLKAMHSGHVYGTARPPTDLATSSSIGISRNNPEADLEVAHPVVRRHPTSGREALFVNPIYTTRFEGMSAAESEGLLAFLYRHATRPEFTCRVSWTAGQLLLWDNRMTMHYAVNDYDGCDRLLWRTTAAGETPLGPA